MRKWRIKVLPKELAKHKEHIRNTTSWNELSTLCPTNEQHTITGSTNKVWCNKCMLEWHRKDLT